jgi:hypothetical protein
MMKKMIMISHDITIEAWHTCSQSDESMQTCKEVRPIKQSSSPQASTTLVLTTLSLLLLIQLVGEGEDKFLMRRVSKVRVIE